VQRRYGTSYQKLTSRSQCHALLFAICPDVRLARVEEHRGRALSVLPGWCDYVAKRGTRIFLWLRRRGSQHWRWPTVSRPANMARFDPEQLLINGLILISTFLISLLHTRGFAWCCCCEISPRIEISIFYCIS